MKRTVLLPSDPPLPLSVLPLILLDYKPRDIGSRFIRRARQSQMCKSIWEVRGAKDGWERHWNRTHICRRLSTRSQSSVGDCRSHGVCMQQRFTEVGMTGGLLGEADLEREVQRISRFTYRSQPDSGSHQRKGANPENLYFCCNVRTPNFNSEAYTPCVLSASELGAGFHHTLVLWDSEDGFDPALTAMDKFSNQANRDS